MASIENISVHVRVRPLSEQEKEKGGKAWSVESNTIRQIDTASGALAGDVAPYTLDTVFDGACSTAQVYERTTRGLIKQVVEGFNSTVFAYGQTSSGKTHTMRGTADDPGLVPRAVKEIFDLINSNKEREYLLRVSYMELYNEDINDLLAPDNMKLHIHESRESGIHVAGLREDIVSSPAQVLELLESGEAHRHVGETKMNKNSSRSHTIFRMIIESRSISGAGGDDGGAIRVSALTLVDLAGSERISKTGAEGQRMKEGAAINKSLLTLGTVINKLSEGVAAAGGHIPYRDSKLTRILQPSLGGNAKTAIICAITPATHHAEESHSTLRFACRAKRVVNNATVNEVLSDAAVLKRQANEIEELRRILQSSGNTQIEEEISRLRAELLRKDQENDRMVDALAAEKEERERVQRKVENMTRLMLEGQDTTRAPGSDSKSKSKRDNRRITWCPGAAQRKRPLLPSLANLAEGEEEAAGGMGSINGKNNGTGNSFAAQRRSDGGALVTWGGTSNAHSPPHKFQRSSLTGTVDGAHDVAAQSTETLQARVRELETANDLMQRELDAVAEAAQRTQKQLRDAEDEIMTIAEERDTMGPALKEAQWKTRQLERQLAETLEERDAASAAVADMASALQNAAAVEDASGDEVHDQLQAANNEIAKLKASLEAAESKVLELEGIRAEKERLDEKLATAKAAAAEAEEKAKAQMAEAVEARTAQTAAEERAEAAEGRGRELYEETQRLSSHISDLESRKRAPLYQKRQEDELRHATEKATMAEVRAGEAELRAKEAKVAQDAAEAKVDALLEALDKAKRSLADEVADVRTEAQAAAQRASAEAERAASRQAEALKEAHVAQQSAISARTELESVLTQRNEDIDKLKSQVAELQSACAALEGQLNETQECADAAAEHVKYLEERSEQEATAAAGEKKEVEAALETLRQEMTSATQAHTAAMEAAALEREALSEVNTALEAAKSELENKVALAAGALHAAEELKELRRKYKEDVARLNQAVKSASMGSKGTERAADRAAKDSERLRNQIKDLEGKLRAAVADKNSAQLEKAAVDRDLRDVRAQLEKLTKSMSRINGIEDRKRESIMVGLNQTKSRLATVEENLERAQVDLEKCQFELQAKHVECDSVMAELEEARNVGSEASARADELSAQIEEAEAEIAALTQELSTTRDALEERQAELMTATEKTIALETSMAELEDAKALLSHENTVMNADLEAACAAAEATGRRLAEVEARLPEIEELHAKLKEANSKMEAAEEADLASKAHADALRKEILSLKTQIDELTECVTAEKGAAESAAVEAAAKISGLETSLENRAGYISSLESQINDAMAEAMESKASAEAAEAQCTSLETKLSEAETTAQALRESVEQLQVNVSAALEEAAEAKGECSKLRVQLEEGQNAMTELQEKLHAADDGTVVFEEKIASLQARAAELETEIDNARSEKRSTESELQMQVQQASEATEKWKEVVDSLQTAQKTMESEATETVVALQAAEARAAELESRLAETEAMVLHTEKCLTAERDDLAARLSELEGSMSAGAADAAHAATALCQERKANDELRATLAQLQAQIEQQRAEWSQHVHQLEEAHTLSSTAARDETTKHIAALSNRIKELEAHVLRSAEEAASLQQLLNEANQKVAQYSNDTFKTEGNASIGSGELELRCSALEQELRKSRRREEKLQALQFRLREDLRLAGGDLAAFDQLKDVRALEYEMDRAANKASREKAALKQALAEVQAALKGTSRKSSASLAGSKGAPLADKENNIAL